MSNVQRVKSPYDSVIFEDGSKSAASQPARTRLASWGGSGDIGTKLRHPNTQYKLGVPVPKNKLMLNWLNDHSVSVALGAVVVSGILLLLFLLAIRTGHFKTAPRQTAKAAVSTGTIFARK